MVLYLSRDLLPVVAITSCSPKFPPPCSVACVSAFHQEPQHSVPIQSCRLVGKERCHALVLHLPHPGTFLPGNLACLRRSSSEPLDIGSWAILNLPTKVQVSAQSPGSTRSTGPSPVLHPPRSNRRDGLDVQHHGSRCPHHRAHDHWGCDCSDRHLVPHRLPASLRPGFLDQGFWHW